jgi:hypothetical protein
LESTHTRTRQCPEEPALALQGRCGWEKEAARKGLPSSCAAEYGLECSPREPQEVAASYPASSATASSSSGGGGGSQGDTGDEDLTAPPRTSFPIEVWARPLVHGVIV